MRAKRHKKSITVTANSVITIDAAHRGSHSLLQNDWLCLAGSSTYVAEAPLLKLYVCVSVCVGVWEAKRSGGVGEAAL